MTSMRRSMGKRGLWGWGQRTKRHLLLQDPSSWTGRTITWGPVLGVMGAIYGLSAMSQPFGANPVWYDEVIGIVGHFCEFGLLALAWRWALMRQWPDLRYPVWIAMIFILAFAIGDEFHQSFVPGRFADSVDVFTDMAGAATALGFWRVKG